MDKVIDGVGRCAGAFAQQQAVGRWLRVFESSIAEIAVPLMSIFHLKYRASLGKYGCLTR
jgi:hypothetical protein